MEDKFLGHTVQYWLELNKRPKEIKAEELIEEIVELKGQLSFVQSRLEQISQILK
jgi:hypothetical protein